MDKPNNPKCDKCGKIEEFCPKYEEVKDDR